MNKTNISAVIIAKNEEKNLPDCLRSLDFVDEILVFDNDSKDATSKIGKTFGAKVFELRGGNFSDRKNAAFKKASGEWILSIDADERVTDELKSEILSLLGSYKSQLTANPNKQSRTSYSAFAMPRKNIILGKELKHGWWPDYVVRLFLKRDFHALTGELHEQPSFEGNLGYFKNALIHLKHDNLADMVEKTNTWSEIEARLMFDANHPRMNILRFLSAMFREIRTRFLKERAFLDGSEGLIYGIYQVYSRYISYGKLWEMQINVTSNNKKVTT